MLGLVAHHRGVDRRVVLRELAVAPPAANPPPVLSELTDAPPPHRYPEPHLRVGEDFCC